MSKIALEGNASGTGTFTIASPNSNSNYTLTLPSSTGTVVVTGGAQTIEFAAGTAASPSITFTGDTNTGIFSPGADTIAFAEGGAEAMRINSSGNVGIGTDSPSEKLHVGGRIKASTAATGAVYFIATNAYGSTLYGQDGTGGYILTDYSAPILFYTNNTERMRIDSSGNVGIGTSSPSYKLDVDRASVGIVARFKGGTRSAHIYSDNDAVYFTSDTGVATAFGCNEASDLLTFYTGNTERARITASGEFLVGTTTATSTFDAKTTTLNRVAYFNNETNANGNQGIAVTLGSNCNNTTSYAWINTIAGAGDKYYIYGNGTTGTPSDIRLKKNIETARNGYLEDLAKLRIVKYNWKTDEENTPKELGVIAQEVEQVFPGIVSSRVDEQTKEETKAVKHSVFVPMLIKAVQELNAKVDAQTTRIEALEAEVAALKGQ